jgi:hypothetical protein
VGFFDEQKPPDWEPEEEAEPEDPEWISPPRDWVGGVVPLELLVASSEAAAVFVTHLVAYPTGFGFTLHAFVRRDLEPDLLELEHLHPRRRRGKGLPPELLRYGIEFSDGRAASNVHQMLDGSTSFIRALGEEGSEPDPRSTLILSPGRGGGGQGHSEQTCWVWPLPPEGPLSFVCEWPVVEIPETRVEVDAGLIIDAASKAREVWSPPGE